MSADGPLRVVFDTNVVLSALVFSGGPAARLRSAWQSNACSPLVCTETVRELVRVLAYPKLRLDAAAREELMADYLPYAEVVEIPSPAPAVPPCRDPFDVPFLQLATAGKAKILVTGDGDLLALSAKLPFRILSINEFLVAIRSPV